MECLWQGIASCHNLTVARISHLENWPPLFFTLFFPAYCRFSSFPAHITAVWPTHLKKTNLVSFFQTQIFSSKRSGLILIWFWSSFLHCNQRLALLLNLLQLASTFKSIDSLYWWIGDCDCDRFSLGGFLKKELQGRAAWYIHSLPE